MYSYVVGRRRLPWPGYPNGLGCGTILTGEDARRFETLPHLAHLAKRVPAEATKVHEPDAIPVADAVAEAIAATPDAALPEEDR